jgi:hypothetical protein
MVVKMGDMHLFNGLLALQAGWLPIPGTSSIQTDRYGRFCP